MLCYHCSQLCQLLISGGRTRAGRRWGKKGVVFLGNMGSLTRAGKESREMGIEFKLDKDHEDDDGMYQSLFCDKKIHLHALFASYSE